MVLCLASVLTSPLIAHSFEIVEVPVKTCRASRLLKRMQAMGPSAANSEELVAGTAWADDLKGVIRFRGSTKDIDWDRQIVRQFDSVPRSVTMTVSIDSAVDKRDYSIIGKMFNNEPWSTGDDQSTGVKLTLTARINDDGTLTIAAKYQRDAEPIVQVVSRVKNGTDLSLTPILELNEAKKPLLPDPKIVIRATIAD